MSFFYLSAITLIHSAVGGVVPINPSNFITQENGFYLLQENGDKILLE